MRTAATLSLLVPALLVSACGDRRAADTGVTVDTLPGGIVRSISTAPAEPGRWTLELARDVQPEDGSEGELLEPIELALADDGSVIVFEESGRVQVYDPSGRFVRAMGRSGSGPGEFQAGMLALRGDTLLVADPLNQRVSAWLWRTGALVAEQRTVCCVWSSVGTDAEGRLWVPMLGSPPDSGFTFSQTYHRTTATGGGADTVIALERRGLPRGTPWRISTERMQMTMDVPLQPKAIFVPDPKGGLITGWSGEYSLRLTSDGRDTTALFGRTWTPVSVTAAEKSRIVEARVALQMQTRQFDEATWRRALDPSLIPSTRPAWESVSVDGHARRWIGVSQADSTRRSFDLFSPEGRWLDTVHVSHALWPLQSSEPAWAREEVAVIIEAEDGRPMLRVFAIRRR